ncbi:hypothetical protein D3C81_442780 [compost metagenome]
MAAEEGDIAMPAFDQMTRGHVRAVLIVEGEEIPLGADQFAVEQQHVGMRTEHLRQRLRVAAFGRGKNETGGRVLHQRRQHRLLPLR